VGALLKLVNLGVDGAFLFDCLPKWAAHAAGGFGDMAGFVVMILAAMWLSGKAVEDLGPPLGIAIATLIPMTLIILEVTRLSRLIKVEEHQLHKWVTRIVHPLVVAFFFLLLLVMGCVCRR
jgi:hypothetical protein